MLDAGARISWKLRRTPVHPTLQGKDRVSLDELLAYYEQEIGTPVGPGAHRRLFVQLVERWGPDFLLFCIDQAAAERDSLAAAHWPGVLCRFAGQASRARGRLLAELREQRRARRKPEGV